MVLVEPSGALNVGSVARLCANYGVERLRLVAPRCDPLGEEARRMAVRGVGVLERAALFHDLASALSDCHRVVATSGRREGVPLELQDDRSCLAWLSAGPTGQPVALVFGREDRGLSNDELLQAGRLLNLPTASAYTSLNLSHAVAIALHAWHREVRQERPPSEPAENGAEPCRRGELEALLDDAEALLLEVGFLYPHTAAARMAKVRALLQRGAVRGSEVALLRGMVRQLRWASHQGANPAG
ncbi:RNA methyltransferase [Cyanobium sp. NIES-981]|uniref:RNA methyltransferase n=1 Tax=Cyanobium sp. NIES-981 TaxID=1851505 RepID=UPI000B3602E3|nr:TrmJ/YjtD family RNA methyltransferase [Cyanobium sp. NIES-981]